MAVRAVLCNDPRSGCGRALLSQLEFAKRAKVAQERNPDRDLEDDREGPRRAGHGGAGVTLPLRAEDVCTCGHDRQAHVLETQQGWTVCKVTGCRCVRFIEKA